MLRTVAPSYSDRYIPYIWLNASRFTANFKYRLLSKCTTTKETSHRSFEPQGLERKFPILE